MKKTLYTVLPLIVMVCSCAKEIPAKENDYPETISTNVTSVTLPSSLNASGYLLVKYEGKWNLKIKQAGNWLMTDVTGGTGNTKVNVAVRSANFSGETRVATIEISAEATTSQPLNIEVEQEPYVQSPWNKLNGGTGIDEWKDVVRTPEGSFIAVGNTTSSNDSLVNRGREDILVGKFNPDGTVIWQKTFGGSGWDLAYSIEMAHDSNFLVAARSVSIDGDVAIPFGNTDMGWLIKIDRDGNVIWDKTYGYGVLSGSCISHIIRDRTGGYLLAGWQSNNGWVLKINETGDILWEKTFDKNITDLLLSGFQDIEGNFILAGITNSGSQGDIWAFKIDASGNLIWNNTFDGNFNDEAYSIVPSPDGGSVIAGYSHNVVSDGLTIVADYDMWVLKLNANGEVRWQRKYGSTANDFAYSIIPFEGGDGYVIAGHSEGNDEQVYGAHGGSDAWIIKIDEIGNLNWQQPYGGSATEVVSSIIYAGNEHYLAAGSSNSNDGDATGALGDKDAWLFITKPLSY